MLKQRRGMQKMKTANEILDLFKDAPSVAKWAAGKTKVITDKATSDFPYDCVKHVFSGEFKKSKNLTGYLEQVECDGSEFMVSVSVDGPKYKGQKSHVSVMISQYTPA